MNSGTREQRGRALEEAALLGRWGGRGQERVDRRGARPRGLPRRASQRVSSAGTGWPSRAARGPPRPTQMGPRPAGRDRHPGQGALGAESAQALLDPPLGQGPGREVDEPRLVGDDRGQERALPVRPREGEPEAPPARAVDGGHPGLVRGHAGAPRPAGAGASGRDDARLTEPVERPARGRADRLRGPRRPRPSRAPRRRPARRSVPRACAAATARSARPARQRRRMGRASTPRSRASHRSAASSSPAGIVASAAASASSGGSPPTRASRAAPTIGSGGAAPAGGRAGSRPGGSTRA